MPGMWSLGGGVSRRILRPLGRFAYVGSYKGDTLVYPYLTIKGELGYYSLIPVTSTSQG